MGAGRGRGWFLMEPAVNPGLEFLPAGSERRGGHGRGPVQEAGLGLPRVGYQSKDLVRRFVMEPGFRVWPLLGTGTLRVPGGKI